MQLTVRYFAWVRERIGKSDEVVDVPNTVTTVEGLIAWLTARGVEYEHAFGDAKLIRAAIDQTHVKAATSLEGAREVAFFPPVTGG